MPTPELADAIISIVDDVLIQISYAAEYVPLPPPKRIRPSDGQPSGSKHFDMDEYLTRKAERIAADPETHRREKAADRQRRNKLWDGYKEQHDFDNCNAALAESRVSCEHRYGSYNRLLNIWSTIILAEQSERLDRIHLGQASRIANVKNLERCQGRTRGIGAAAKRAGY